MAVLYALIICLGVWLAVSWKGEARKRERTQLLQQAGSVAETLNSERTAQLAFDASDLTNPAYQQLTEQLNAYTEAVGLRDLYVVALKGDQIVMGPGRDLSPGTPLSNPSSAITELFRSGVPQFNGPLTNDNGQYLEAVVPIAEINNIAVCIETNAENWNRRMKEAMVYPLLATILPPGLILLGWLIYCKKSASLKLSPQALRNIQVGIWSMTLLMLTTIITLRAYHNDRREQHDLFHTHAAIKSGNYAESFKNLRSALRLTIRFMESSEEVTPEEFSLFCHNLLNESSTQAVMWLPALQPSDTADFTRLMREHTADFTIQPMPGTNSLAPSATIYPAAFIEPAITRNVLQGIDLYSNPKLRNAIEKALSTGLASSAILPENPDCGGNLIVFKPLEHPRHKGMVAVSANLDRITDHLSSQSSDVIPGISTTMFSLQAGSPPEAVGCSECTGSSDCKKLLETDYQASIPIFAFGKTFMILMSAGPEWMASQPHNFTGITLAIGLVLTLVFSYIAFVLCSKPIELEQQVQERTKELIEIRQRCDIAAGIANMGVWELSLTDNMLSFDERLALMFGFDSIQLTRPFEDFVDCIFPEDRQRIMENIEIAHRGGQPARLEFRITTPHGKIRYIQAFAKALLDDDGKATRLIGANQDVTEQKTMEQRVKESEKNFRDMIETLPLALYLAAGEGHNLEYMNPAFLKLFGYPPEEIPNAAEWFKLAYPDPKYRKKVETEWMKKVQRAAETQSPIEPMETVVRCKDGSEKTIFWGHIPMGKKNYAYGLDLTELKRTEQELRSSESFMNSVIDQSPFPMWVADSTGTLIRANQALCSTLNLTREKLVGKYNVLKDENLEGEMREQIKRLFEYHESVHLNTLWKPASVGGELDLSTGRNVYIDASIIPIMNAKGGLTHIVCQWVDITERKEAEERLSSSNDELARFNKVAVGRELRMIELKQEINALCRRLSIPEIYPEAEKH
ncbi:MAG: PAS domain S-box protein [Pontiellaceae bacterium]|nr:PAS domain S-box protein [Pontiellaceae bacterium]